MRRLFKLNLVGLLALLSLFRVQPVFANTIFEKEANDSTAQANQTFGSSNLLTVFGQSVGLVDSLDLDYFRFLVTTPGDIRIEGFGKSAGTGLTLDFVLIMVNGPNEEFVAIDSGPNPLLRLNGLAAGTYHAIVASGLPQPPGSAGTYRIEIQGVNGGTVAGTMAAPEPDSLGFFGLSLITLASVSVRWRQRR